MLLMFKLYRSLFTLTKDVLPRVVILLALLVKVICWLSLEEVVSGILTAEETTKHASTLTLLGGL